MKSLVLPSVLAAVVLVAQPTSPAAQPAAPAQPAPAPAPRPASTGQEMPRSPALDVEQARAKVLSALAAAKAGKPDCNKISQDLAVSFDLAFPRPNADAVPTLQLMQMCAVKAKRWNLAVRAGTTLVKLAPDQADPDQLVRAYAELGEHEQAITIGMALMKKFPKEAPELLAAVTMVLCQTEKWKPCLATADKALKLFRKHKLSETSEAMLKTRITRDGAWLVTGEVKKAHADLAALERLDPKLKVSADKLRRMAETSTRQGMFVSVVKERSLPLGVYHLMGKDDTGALLTLKFVEHTGKARKLRVEAEVPGVTERTSRTLTLGKRGEAKVLLNPPLKIDFNPASIRGPRPAQIAVRIIETTKSGDQVVLEETLTVEILPRDYLVFKRIVGADAFKPTFGFLGAWVTPNDPSVDAFLAAAKKRAPEAKFSGEQGPTVPQVKALFDELKARGMSYVMDPGVFSETLHVQRTRLPAEVLSSTNAQCVEGTLLFATLLEAIGVRPLIVLVPGHAFVGWMSAPKDGLKGEPIFLETTSVGNATFEQAVTYGNGAFKRNVDSGAFDSKAATVLNLAKLRRSGFTAQPL